MRLWSVNSGTCLVIKGFTGAVHSIAWQPYTDNPKLVTGSGDRAIRCWQIQEKEKDKLHAALCWSSHQAVLIAPKVNLDNVKGLSQENLKLLQQRGTRTSLEEKKKSSPNRGNEKASARLFSQSPASEKVEGSAQLLAQHRLMPLPRYLSKEKGTTCFISTP